MSQNLGLILADFLKIKYIGVTLVYKIIQVSGEKFYSTPSVHNVSDIRLNLT